MIDPEKARRFSELKARKKRLKAQTDEIETELSALEEEILDEWAETGTSQVKVDGATVHIRRELWPKYRREEFGGDLDAVRAATVEALEQIGMADYVIPGTQKLRGWLRHLEETGEEIPEPLASCLTTEERYKLGVRFS